VPSLGPAPVCCTGHRLRAMDSRPIMASLPLAVWSGTIEGQPFARLLVKQALRAKMGVYERNAALTAQRLANPIPPSVVGTTVVFCGKSIEVASVRVNKKGRVVEMEWRLGDDSYTVRVDRSYGPMEWWVVVVPETMAGPLGVDLTQFAYGLSRRVAFLSYPRIKCCTNFWRSF